ncbi:type II/IV secretion system ATPase subunit [Natrarchaeobius oligotrophus]|uniref:Type II secretion system protein n=1 Tax=Natrarchaeobius chitinivorans TaxID=1679083 RepID=A0A3N6MU28_NATCH|nr:type II/IV secretion system ATPase subunit [Natrarchaeobius chitinivorans]RQG99791.1 type II secretion system protein [Natrarchaeobius chitinivorans]
MDNESGKRASGDVGRDAKGSRAPDAASRAVPSDEHDRTAVGRSSTLEAALRTVRRVSEAIRGSEIDVPEYDPASHGPLVDFDGVDGLEEVDRYWVNAPFSFVWIGRDPTTNHHRYHVVEPTLDGDERVLFDALYDDVRDPLLYRERDGDDVETLLRETVREYLERYGAEIDPSTFYRIFYRLHRDFRGYGRLDPIMHDHHVEDVSCDGYDLPLFVYHDEYTDVETNVSFERTALDRFVVRLAQHSGRHISIGDPMVETTLPDGSRAELALGEEVTPRGSAFTIRKYADEPFTPIDLVEYGTFSVEQMAYLWLAIEHNKSLLFAGGTASGKTTSMNAVSMFIPPRSKVLTIEDTRELQLHHDNWLSSVTRDRIHEGTHVTMYDLLRSALRHRPEYIVVGEVRGEEAITLFQAMNTGHTTYSTMHADSVQTVINRLENEPINVPRPMVQSLDVLSIQQLTRLEDGRVRRNKVLAEIEGIDQRTGELDYSPAFTWDGETDTVQSKGSQLLEEIREERGWSRTELLTELENRERFLEYLRRNEITDYRRFTALINEYYADKARVLEDVDADAVDDSLDSDAGTNGEGARPVVDAGSRRDDRSDERDVRGDERSDGEMGPDERSIDEIRLDERPDERGPKRDPTDGDGGDAPPNHDGPGDDPDGPLEGEFG